MASPDVMRREPKTLTGNEVADLDFVKKAGNTLHAWLSELGDSRELSVAKTKLEEAVMWAVKHITK